MKVRKFATCTLAAIVMMMGAGLTAAGAETVSLAAELSSANEVPQNDSAASGTAEATLDTETRMLTFSIRFEGLSGPVIGAHLHGPVGVDANAGVMVPFATMESPIEGTLELTADQVRDVTAGLSYVNIHTQNHPGGEIRGQLVQ